MVKVKDTEQDGVCGRRPALSSFNNFVVSIVSVGKSILNCIIILLLLRFSLCSGYHFFCGLQHCHCNAS